MTGFFSSRLGSSKAPPVHVFAASLSPTAADQSRWLPFKTQPQSLRGELAFTSEPTSTILISSAGICNSPKQVRNKTRPVGIKNHCVAIPPFDFINFGARKGTTKTFWKFTMQPQRRDALKNTDAKFYWRLAGSVQKHTINEDFLKDRNDPGSSPWSTPR
jgi:hypothetical protein